MKVVFYLHFHTEFFLMMKNTVSLLILSLLNASVPFHSKHDSMMFRLPMKLIRHCYTSYICFYFNNIVFFGDNADYLHFPVLLSMYCLARKVILDISMRHYTRNIIDITALKHCKMSPCRKIKLGEKYDMHEARGKAVTGEEKETSEGMNYHINLA